VKIVIITTLAFLLTSCDKVGVGGTVSQVFGSWAELRLPPGCVAKQISAEESSGVAILCEDGRVFH
jgi:hypothetical protein